MRVKGWKRFQHFKDRRPIWIKLYRDILEDIEWFKLDGESAKALIMIWLIASEDEGNLPTIEELSFRLRIQENKLIQIVTKLDHWLEHDNIKMISERYQLDALEKEKRREEKIYCASDDALIFISSKGKKLTGKRLETFNQFWDAFDYKKSKAAAADSWMNIGTLTDAIVHDIIKAAKAEASNRKDLIAKGITPKMAQGWLTERRWEDEVKEKKESWEFV